MTSLGIYFPSIITFTVILYTGFLRLTRKIHFAFPQGEDSLTMVDIAAQSSLLRWPSQVQRPNILGMYMKGVTILLLVLFQKVFRDKKSMVPLVALWATANAISTILVFLIAASYFNPLIGFILSLLFVTSFWPWQTALTMGHINIATTIFLAGVYSTIHIFTFTGNTSPLWLASAGAFFACLFFSSSSAIKYFPFAFVSLVFAKYRSAFEHGGVLQVIQTVLTPHGEAMIAYIIIPIVLIIALLIVLLVYKQLISRVYAENAPSWLLYVLSLLRFDMAGKSQFTLEHYLVYAKNKISQAAKIWIFRAYLFGVVILYPLGLYFLLIFLAGFIAMILFWTLPHVKKGLSFYWHYIRNTQVRQKTAFRGWDEYFAAKGVHTNRYFTASGVKWLPKFFIKFIPGPIIIFYASAIFLIVSKLVTHNSLGLINSIIIMFISILPCLWGEMTNSPKYGRVYLSAYPGFLLLIGYALYQINPNTFSRLILLTFSILVVFFIWNMWKFLSDIFPSRMTVFNLIKCLNDLDIKEFYTYRTDYNLMLIGTINPELRKLYTIHYIDNLTEVKDGWIVIPGTSLKTSFWVTDEMRSGIDSIRDPIYNELFEMKKIEQIATAKFKTFSSSPLWIMDSEITSFQELILHANKAEDFLRGHAWLLHSSKLQQKWTN